METMTPFSPDQIKNPLAGSNTLGADLLKPQSQIPNRKNEGRKAVFYLLFSIMILGGYSVLFFIPNMIVYFDSPKKIEAIESRVMEYQNETLVNLSTEKQLHQASYNKEFEELNNALNEVFPVGVDKGKIVRTLEQFATRVNTVYPPFILTGITIGETRQVENYLVTNVGLNINNQSSQQAFEELLKLVKASGYLNINESEGGVVSKDVLIPLMALKTVNLTYGEDENQGKVNFAVHLEFFSRINETITSAS